MEKLIRSLRSLGAIVLKIELRLNRCKCHKKGKYFPLFMLRETVKGRIREVEECLYCYLDKGVAHDIMSHEQWLETISEAWKELS